MSSSTSGSVGESIALSVFTIQQAQSRLPLVRCIVKDLMTLSRQMDATRSRLEALKLRRSEKANGGQLVSAELNDIYGQELLATEVSLAKDELRREGFVEELLALDVEPLDYSAGVVCFASSMFGRPVSLSWKYDEPSIAFWHENDSDFSTRQPIVGVTPKPDAAHVNRIENQFDDSI